MQFKENGTTSLKKIKEILKENYPKCIDNDYYEVLDRITENINDLKSRYLLVISKSSVSTFLISSVLQDLNKEYSLYIGSKFPEDQQSEEYSLKILNKIQLHMEEGKVLILKNLESVYPALYDLFNQNFTEVSKKNYARIAIGSSTNTFSYVNDNFRCIVNVDDDQIEQEEPPFLNRFEKHIVSFKYLLKPELEKVSENIYNILNEMIKCNKNIYKGINYDLKKIFINSDLEEIQGIIYQSYKKGIKIEDMMSEVISKISPILPQDILLCLKLNGFQSKYADITNQIFEEYKKGEHSNMRKFLEKMENMKNVIYTFSNNLDIIENIKNINNKILGEINIENIKQLKISSIKSENEFEKEIDDFFEKNQYLICFINFNANEGTYLNYIKFFTENKEKDYFLNKKDEDDKPKKAFIFIVHLVRIFDSELKDIKNKTPKEKKKIKRKILKETISNLSGYYQIFIDNLNGVDDLNFENLIKLKGIQLYEKCLDFDYALRRNIYTSLSYMKFNIPFNIGELNENTYVNKLISYISNDKELKDNINNCIKNQMTSQKEDFIIKACKEKDSVTQIDRDIINIIKKYLSKLYTKQLNILYFKAEKDNFFSSLLSIDEENKIFKELNEKGKADEIQDNELEYIKKIRETIKIKYFEKLKDNYHTFKIPQKQGENVLNIILGLKLPGIKPIIDSVKKYIHDDIVKRYRKNENSLRGHKEGEIERIKNKFIRELAQCNNSTLIEINKSGAFLDIKDIYTQSYFNDLFLEDYYSLFIFNNIKNIKRDNDNNNKKYDDILKMLKYIVELRKKKFVIERISQNDISNIINWIECYSSELSTILQMFSNLNNIVDNLFDLIKAIIDNKEIKYETNTNDRCWGASSIVNEPLFLGMEAILRVITSNENIYQAFEENTDEFTELMNVNKEILQKALKLENSLHLFSKEVFSLHEILEINDCFYLNKVDVINISKVIKFFKEQTNYIILEDNNNLIKNFEELFKFLQDSLKGNKLFPKVMSIIFKNEYFKLPNSKYAVELLNNILKENEFIYHCYPIFKKIIPINSTPESMERAIKNILENKSKPLKILNDNKKDFLDEIIINFMEYTIISFFNSIPNLDYKKEKYIDYFKTYCDDKKTNKYSGTTIIFDLPQRILRDCFSLIYDDQKENENKHLAKLFAITYIKIYLNIFINFIHGKSQLIKDYNEIVGIIEGGKKNCNIFKLIKIYILKIIFNLLNRNWQELLCYNYNLRKIEFITDILTDEKESSMDKSFLTNYFLPLDTEEDKNNYLKTCENFKNYKDESKEFIEISDNNIDIFLTVSINKIISNLGLNINMDTETSNNSQKSESEYSQFSKFCETKLNNYNNNLKNLLLLFYNENKYIEILKPKIKEQRNKKQYVFDIFEILLYGFRFCAQTLSITENKNEYFYTSLLSKDCMTIIENNFIPGNNCVDDLKITSLKEIRYHFNNYPEDTGCYVCSCGYYYSIGPCGFPTKGNTSKCPKCQLDIGYGEKKIKNKGAENHGLVQREGHYRIFKNKEQKERQMKRWNDPDKTFLT